MKYWKKEQIKDYQIYAGTITPASNAGSISIANPFKSKDKVKSITIYRDGVASYSVPVVMTLHLNNVNKNGFVTYLDTSGRNTVNESTSISDMVQITDENIIVTVPYSYLYWYSVAYKWEVLGNE